MALMHVCFFSEALMLNVNCDVIIPQKSRALIGMATSREETYRTLYLLHGLSDDCTIWQRRTSIERYAANRNMAVVMPSADRSWYTDMKYGGAYRTFIAEELPSVMRSFFSGMSNKREDNFIAGLSMGGYGAMKIGLLKSENFAGIAAFSGAYDLYPRAFERSGNSNYWKSIFGDDPEAFKQSDDNVYALVEKKASEGAPKPKIYMWCGTEDGLLGESRELCAHLTRFGYNPEYHESPGDHSWKYWDEQIKIALDFFDSDK